LQKEAKILGLIGMAMKAGHVASGGFAVEKMIQSGRAAAVFVAGDASENTKKQFRTKCEFYEIPFAVISDKETLGHAIGKEFRSVVSVNDKGFAASVQKLAGMSDKGGSAINGENQ
jgi:ribosomal protein L7Ae-like RNA K-turn-binding protein